MNRTLYNIIVIAFFLPTSIWTSEESSSSETHQWDAENKKYSNKAENNKYINKSEELSSSEEDVPKQHAIVYFSGRGDSFETHQWDAENKKYSNKAENNKYINKNETCVKLTLSQGPPSFDDKEQPLSQDYQRFVHSYANTLLTRTSNKDQDILYTPQYADGQIDLYSCTQENIDKMIGQLIEISQTNKTITLVGYDIGALLVIRLLNNIDEDKETEGINNLKQKITDVEFHDPLIFPETARSLTVPFSFTIGGVLYGMPLLTGLPIFCGVPAAPIVSFCAYFFIGTKLSNWCAKQYYQALSWLKKQHDADDKYTTDISKNTLPYSLKMIFLSYSLHNVSSAKQIVTNQSTKLLPNYINNYYMDCNKRNSLERNEIELLYDHPPQISYFTQLWWKICSPSTAINACVCLMLVAALKYQDVFIEILQKYVTINR